MHQRHTLYFLSSLMAVLALPAVGQTVRRAALELDEGAADKGDRLLGGPTAIHLERIVDGALSGRKWEEALEAIKHSFGVDGKEILEGPTREWTHRDQMGGRVRVSMTPSGRQTRLRVSYGMTEWLWLHFIMVCVGIGPVCAPRSGCPGGDGHRASYHDGVLYGGVARLPRFFPHAGPQDAQAT